MPATFFILLYLHVITAQSVQGFDDVSVKKDSRILILGAGMAGISAAKRLHEKGHTNFLILEGSHRIGGRMKEIQIGKFVVEAGASWIQPAGNNPVYLMAQRYNLSSISPHDDLYTVLDGMGRDVTAKFLSRNDERFVPAQEFAARYAADCPNRGTSDFTLRSALLMGGWRPNSAIDDIIEFFFVDFSYGFPSGEVSGLYSAVNDFYVVYNSTQDRAVNDRRGFSHLVRSLSKEFLTEDDNRLKLMQDVEQIEQTDDGVTVRTIDNVTYTGDYVIVTFSIGVLQHNDVQFSPPLPLWKREAINQFQQALLLHVYIQFSEPFWGNHEFFLYASERRNYFNIWHNFNRLLPGSNILEIAVVGEEVRRVERMEDTEIIKEAVSVLKVMFGEERVSEPVAYVVPRWLSNPHFRGAYSNWPPGFTLDSFKRLQAPVGRIFFAGEYADAQNYGYIQGAHLSGNRVADNVNECIESFSTCNLKSGSDVAPVPCNGDPAVSSSSPQLESRVGILTWAATMASLSFLYFILFSNFTFFIPFVRSSQPRNVIR